MCVLVGEKLKGLAAGAGDILPCFLFYRNQLFFKARINGTAVVALKRRENEVLSVWGPEQKW